MIYLSPIIQYVISGITSGSIYAIVGVCWSIVFLVTKIMNFSTGEFVMLGGMLTWAFSSAGIGLVPAIILATGSTVIIGVILERLAIRPVKYHSEMTFMVITIASATIIKGIILITCGSEARLIRSLISSKPISFLGAMVTSQAMLVMGVVLILAILLSLFFNHTLFGRALRATAINPEGAQLVGIRIGALSTFCFGLAGGLGAIAGIVITPITFTGYSVGLMTGLKGLVAAIIGGWNMPGTVLAALSLGLLEGLVGGFISPGWQDAVAFLVMIIFLIYRSIFSPRETRKV